MAVEEVTRVNRANTRDGDAQFIGTACHSITYSDDRSSHLLFMQDTFASQEGSSSFSSIWCVHTSVCLRCCVAQVLLSVFLADASCWPAGARVLGVR